MSLTSFFIRRLQLQLQLSFGNMPSSTQLTQRSDQFDIRLNVDAERLSVVLEKLERLWLSGTVRYVHCTSVEIGDIPNRSSFGKEHVHIALILNNYTSRGSIIKKLVDKNYGWYVECRDKTKSLTGWINYHGKERTKCDPSVLFLIQYGNLPRVREPTRTSEVRNQEKVDAWKRRKYLIQTLQWDKLDQEFPGFIWTSTGQNMKREILKQSNDEFTRPIQGDLENYIIYGPSGTGKSSSVALLYPHCYKKQKGSQYWDGYDKSNPDHQVVWIDEMSKETLATLTGKVDGGFEFLKELADRYPVTVDEKYTKGYKIRPRKVIITMNEHPTSLLPDRAIEVNKQALYRKFKIMHVYDWLVLNGLECTTSGCRRKTGAEIDEELTFQFEPDGNAEYQGEQKFNMSRRTKGDQDKGSEKNHGGIYGNTSPGDQCSGRDQGFPASTKSTVSKVLSCIGLAQ